MEAVLTNPPQLSQVELIPVNIDESVTFAYSLVGADQINCGPRTITKQLHPVRNSQLALLDMLA